MHSTTQQLIEHHITAFRQNDLEELMADYSDASLIITLEAEYRGLEEIRAFFVAALALYPTDRTRIEVDKLFTDGDLGYIVWHGETPTFTVSFSTATYLVEEGKIHRHTIGRLSIPKN